MRCRQARLILTQTRHENKDALQNSELREHLAQCPECAEQARAIGTLDNFLDSASADHTETTVPVETQRMEVEARMARLDRGRRGRAEFTRRGFFRRPLYGAGLAMAAAVVALVYLVPFGYYRTIGYDVAFAGVSPELALDDERICDVFYDLGLIEANVDLIGCDTTCNIMVLDLKSAEEVAMVMTALDELSEEQLSSNVIPVVTREKGNLLDRVNTGNIDGRHREVRPEDVL